MPELAERIAALGRRYQIGGGWDPSLHRSIVAVGSSLNGQNIRIYQ
jgi:hypothetical protein